MLTHQVSSGVMTRVALPGCPLDLVPVGCSSTTYINDDFYLIGLLRANMFDMLYVAGFKYFNMSRSNMVVVFHS